MVTDEKIQSSWRRIPIKGKTADIDDFIGGCLPKILDHNMSYGNIVTIGNVGNLSAGNKYVSAQLSACSSDLHVADPNQTASNEGKQNSSNSSYGGIVSANKFCGTSKRDDALDEEGRVFYWLLAGGICLILGLAFLK